MMSKKHNALSESDNILSISEVVALDILRLIFLL